MARRRRFNPVRTDRAIPDLIKNMDAEGRLILVRLWRNWEEVLGPETAAMARPLGRRGNTLILCTDDPIASQELTFFAPQILERVNTFLGQNIFDKVRLELLNGRVPLDGYRELEAPPPPPAPRKPKKLGGLTNKLDADSAIGRAYRAYIDLMGSK